MIDAYYDTIASSYDELYGEEQRAKLAVILSQVSITSKDKVLDVGCGTGVATRTLPCFLIGVDPAIELLRQSPFPVMRASGDALPFLDKSFDVVLSLTAFHHIPDPARALTEMMRVSRRAVVITLLKKSGRYTELAALIRTIPYVKHFDEQKDSIFVIDVHQ